MHIDVTGQHLDVTDSLREYVSTKMERVQRHFDMITDAHVVLSVEKTRHKAEATLKLRGSSVHADVEAEDMYAAIDQLTDRLDRQVRKFKEKQKNHRSKEARHSEVSFEQPEMDLQGELEASGAYA